MGFAAADRVCTMMASGAGRVPVLAPGVWDGLSARLAVHAGQPDLGIIGPAEMAARIGATAWSAPSR